jgi:signal transduction histidine kinase/CheY-like chemotaxis protein
LRLSNEELMEKSEALNIQKEDVEAKNRDIETARADLEEKAKALEVASKYKSEFLANMSHELRTPLNSLLILSESLATNDEGNLSEDQLESINVINSGGIDLLELINDILDLSKVEAGKLSIEIDNIRVDKVTSTMQRQFQHVADKKEVKFIIEIENDIPRVKADKKRLEQILKNLLSNAFKFTSQGSVTLKVSRPSAEVKFSQGTLSQGNCLAFKVIDTGIGIEEAKQDGIFQAFQQADGSTSRRFGGTGLGLTISKELTRLMHGEIQLTSQYGVGSEFTLYIPSESHSTPIVTDGPLQEKEVVKEDVGPLDSSIPSSLPNSSGNSVLIIEDDEDFSRVLQKIVEKKGYKALSSTTGMKGLTLAKLHEPDAILLDLGLPDIDGTKVLEQLKFDLKTRHIPVHVISGRDTDEDLLAMGAIGYINKPVKKQDIDDILYKISDFSSSEEKTILPLHGLL